MKHEPIYYVFRYNLRSQAGPEFKRWLAGHAGAQSGQTGWTYMGTFVDVMGLDRYSYETRWELSDQGSVSTRPLDSETEQRIGDRLPFIEEGQVAMMHGLRGIVPLMP